MLTVPAFVQPIGISFYTMQAMAYLFDVYRGTEKADRNLGSMALFMGFFPQIMEGPIARHSETAAALMAGEPIKAVRLSRGGTRILYGLAKKMIIADRLNVLIMNVFNNPDGYDGGVIAAAAVLYTLQLYMDFSGTIDVALGMGEIFGVTLPENFRQPFFSHTISDFWSRWHVTLGTWLRDYLFYPLTMSKPLKQLTLKSRRVLGNHFGPLLSGAIALICVWLANGLWHGAGWQYIFFGMYHFSLILLGKAFEPLFAKLTGALHVNRESRGYHLWQIIRTTFLVLIGEMFFRASSLAVGFNMFGRIVTDFTFESFATGAVSIKFAHSRVLIEHACKASGREQRGGCLCARKVNMPTSAAHGCASAALGVEFGLGAMTGRKRLNLASCAWEVTTPPLFTAMTDRRRLILALIT